MNRICKGLLVTVFILSTPVYGWGQTPNLLLNASYDSTREFYDSYNKLFISTWKEKTNQKVKITQSHGSSSAQARAVMQGLAADVVTLALAYDIDLIAEKTHLLPANWQAKLPNNSCPYTSTIVFLVRYGNPKGIKDWPDLIGRGVKVISPNPKTSGGARWNYLAAWAYALKQGNGDEQKAKNFMKALYKNIPIQDIGARSATNTFVQRGLGDVLIAWENEAYLVLHKFSLEKFQVVRPSLSISTEPPVAVVTQNTHKKGTTLLAKAYLENLYTPVAQDLIAKFFFRPANKLIAAKYSRLFPAMNLVTIASLGGWQTIQQKHFAKGALFDQLEGEE